MKVPVLKSIYDEPAITIVTFEPKINDYNYYLMNNPIYKKMIAWHKKGDMVYDLSEIFPCDKDPKNIKLTLDALRGFEHIYNYDINVNYNELVSVIDGLDKFDSFKLENLKKLAESGKNNSEILNYYDDAARIVYGYNVNVSEELEILKAPLSKRMKKVQE